MLALQDTSLQRGKPPTVQGFIMIHSCKVDSYKIRAIIYNLANLSYVSFILVFYGRDDIVGANFYFKEGF